MAISIDNVELKVSAEGAESISQKIKQDGVQTIGTEFVRRDGGTVGGTLEFKNGQLSKITLSGEVAPLPANGKTGSSAQKKTAVTATLSDTEASLFLNGNGAGLNFKNNPDGSTEITGGSVGFLNFKFSANQTDTSKELKAETPVFQVSSSDTIDPETGAEKNSNVFGVGVFGAGLRSDEKSNEKFFNNSVEVTQTNSNAIVSLKPSVNLLFASVTFGDTLVVYGTQETTFTDTVTGVTLSVGNSSFFPEATEKPVTVQDVEKAQAELAQSEVNFTNGKNLYNSSFPNGVFENSAQRASMQIAVDANKKTLESLIDQFESDDNQKLLNLGTGLTVATSDLVDKLALNNDRILALESSLKNTGAAIDDSLDIINRLGGKAEEGNGVARLIGDEVILRLSLGPKKTSELGFDAKQLSAEIGQVINDEIAAGGNKSDIEKALKSKIQDLIDVSLSESQLLKIIIDSNQTNEETISVLSIVNTIADQRPKVIFDQNNGTNGDSLNASNIDVGNDVTQDTNSITPVVVDQSQDADDLGFGFHTHDDDLGGAEAHVEELERQAIIDDVAEAGLEAIAELESQLEKALEDQINAGEGQVATGINQLLSDDDATKLVGLLNVVSGGVDIHAADVNKETTDGSVVGGVAGAASGLLAFENAESSLERVTAGVEILDGIGEAITKKSDGISNLGFGEGTSKLTVGKALSVVNLASAIDSGDTTDIAIAGVQAYQALAGSALKVNIGVNGIPVTDIINIADSLLEGDEKSAAISAVSAVVSAFFSPIIGAAVGVILSGFFGDPKPQYSLDFARDENGNIVSGFDKNRSIDDETARTLIEQSGVYANYLTDIESRLSDKLPGGQLDLDKLPTVNTIIGKNGPQTTFGGGFLRESGIVWEVESSEIQRSLTSAVLVSQRNDSWITETRFFNTSDGGYYADVYDPFGSTRVPSVSQAVSLGIWSGGGNVGRGSIVVETTAEDFVTDSEYVYREVEQEFAEVKRTWRANAGIFAGEGANLFALALASGQITIAQAEEQGLLIDPNVSPLDVQLNEEQQALFLAFIAENSDFIAADGVDANELGRGFRPPVEFQRVVDESFADQLEFILGRGQDNIYPEEGFFLNASASGFDDANQRFLEEAQLRSQIVRELAANNNNFELPSLNDLSVTITRPEGALNNIVTITGVDPFTREQVVLTSFEQQTTRFGTSDTFTAIEDRPFYTTIEELLANDREGVVFGGVGGARNGSVSIDAEGNIRFIPEENFFGLASFNYSIAFGGETETVTAFVFVANSPDAPLAVDDEFTFNENTSVSLNALLLNDSDPDGDGLLVSAVSSVSNGQIITDSEGNFVYIPEPGFVGDVEIVYTVSDDAGTGVRTSAAKSTLTFTENGNDAPFVQSEIFSDGVEDTNYVLTGSSLLANDIDPEGGVLTLLSVEAVDPSQGSVNYDSITDTVTFVPVANFNGTVELSYVVSDDGEPGTGANVQTATSTASIVFAPTPDPFATVDHRLAVNDSSTVILTNAAILAGVDNIDGFPIEVVAVRLASGETGGQIRILPNGDVQFTPLSSNDGTVDFQIRLSRQGPDGQERIVSNVSVDVIMGNDAPEANPDSFADAIEETAYTFNQTDLLANDTDAEGDAFVFADIRLVDASQGTVAYNASTGDITVTPNENVFGPVALSYRIQETVSGQFSTGTAEVVFANTNDTANISNKTLVANEDTQTIFTRAALLDASLGEAVDVDGETLNILSATLVDDTQGTISVNSSGDVVFQAAQDFAGDVAFTYEVSDGVEAVTANGLVRVDANNDSPNAENDERLNGIEDEVYTLNVNDLLVNDSDVDNTLSVNDIRLLDASQGSVTLNSVTGEIQFTPSQDINGDVRFEYTVIEDASSSASATGRQTSTAQLRLVLAAQDDTATISNKTFNVDENDTVTIFSQNALLDASLGETVDADGEVLSISSVALNNPADGTITVLASGDVQFTPNAVLVGVDSNSGFTFTITDGVSDIAANATVIRGVPGSPPVDPTTPIGNQGPIQNPAVPLSLVDGQEETQYNFNVATLENAAIDPDGDAFSLTAVSLQDTAQGELVWDRDNGNVSIVPAENVFGNVIVNYTLTDDQGASSDLSTTVAFANVDDAPDVQAQDFRNGLFNVNEDAVNHLFTKETLLDGRLQDVDNENLTILAVRSLTPTGIQTVVLGADESVMLTTVPDYTSDIDAALDDDDATPANDVVFQIDVTDGNTTETIDMTVRVFPENDAPTITDDNETMNEGSVATFLGADLLANDVDVEGDAFSILGIWAVSNGRADYDANTDQITFQPDEDTIGSQWVDYLVRDERGAFSVARLNVEINNTDDPVIANDDMFVVAEDSDFIFDASEFTGNDTNVDQENLRITAIDDSSFTHGSLTLLPDGRVSYVAEADYFGRQTFRYTVADESGNVSEAEVDFFVENINDVPRITVLNQTIDEDIPQTYSFDQLLAQSVDVDGDWVSVVGARSSFGDVTYNEDLQQIEYIPTEHFNSTLFAENAIVEYLLVDENGGQAWGEINIFVNPINDEPVAFDDVIAAWERGPIVYSNEFSQIDLLRNDEEYDGEVLRVLSTTQGTQNGAITLNPSSGVLSYTSADGFIGTDTFTYVVGDGVPDSEDTAQVTVEVFENTGPTANNFVTVTDEDTVLTFDYAQDFAPHVQDVDLNNLVGLPEEHRIVAVSNSQNGTATLNADGTVTFIPDANYNDAQYFATRGGAQFDYTVQDIVGNQSTATTRVILNPVDDAPEAVGDRITARVLEDDQVDFDPSNLVLNDFDVDDPNTPGGQIVDFRLLRADNGSLRANGDGTFRYTPDENFNGFDNIRYRIEDGTGLTDDGVARIFVTPVNDNPTASAVSGEGGDRGSNTLTGVLNSAFDIDGDTLRISRIIGVSGDVTSASISGNNIRWSGNEGSGRIRYEISDGNGGTVETFAVLNIFHENNIPFIERLISSSTLGFDGIENDEGTNPTVTTSGRAIGIDEDNDGRLTVRLINVQGQGSGATITSDSSGNFRVVSVGSGGGTLRLTFAADDGEALTTRTFTVRLPSRAGAPEQESPPIILDLNDNGIELRPYNASNATEFDIDGDGELERLSFATNGDGILAIDLDNDGKIDRSDEIVFTGYVEGAETDLEGLRHFDTNQDGVLNAEDEQFDQFGVVVENGDGVIDESDFISLTDSEIESIDLTSDNVEQSLGDSGRLSGSTTATRTDGSSIQVGDASLTFSDETPDVLLSDDTVNRPDDIASNTVILSDDVDSGSDQSDVLDSDSDSDQSVVLSDPSLLLANPSQTTEMPTDDDVNHAVALSNQQANSKEHSEDLSSQAALPTDDLVTTTEEEAPLVAA